MNTIGGLRTVIYKVADIAAAKAWYAKAFEVEPYFDQPFYVGFSIDGFELGLQPEETLVKEKAESVAAYWATGDVRSTYDRLLSVGALANEAPQEVGGGIVVATVKDPWNNVIGLIYNPHFKNN
jgi:predicted enzyme related to lactoylglutathione lyase